jgi:hypothetical protein
MTRKRSTSAAFSVSRIASSTVIRPRPDGDRAWDADALQFRLTLDPSLGYPPAKQTTSDANTSDQILHLLIWHYTDRD